MDMHRGVFIVIEGTDGSGKGTQFQKLAERLTREGYDVALFDFPQYEQPSSYFVQQYLNGKYGSAEEVGPYTSSLFYALDRFEAAPKIREALQQGKIVLANRYAGSSMAHQGTKFKRAEERRGYFIWLDNLEFEMLQIPRPSISFVLRVPAEVSQQLVDQKETRSYTDKKRDLHEADLGHLQKAVEVFDDLCQLFPKDFYRLDCTRDDQLLSIDTIHEILWQKIHPSLPAPPQTVPSSTAVEIPKTPEATTSLPDASTPSEIAPSSEITSSNALENSLVHDISAASNVLVQKLASYRLASIAKQTTLPSQKNASGQYNYYTPEHFDDQTKATYRENMDTLFAQYNAMTHVLQTHLTTRATHSEPKSQHQANEETLAMQAHDALRFVLPLATTTPITLTATDAQLKDLLTSLMRDPLVEARNAGQSLLQDQHQIAPALLHDLTPENVESTSNQSATASSVKTLAQTLLSHTHAETAQPVQLVELWPRNELDLLPDMLYQYSNVPLLELRETVTSWTYEQKAEVFEAYLHEASLDYSRHTALEKACYRWDIVSNYVTLGELQSHQAVGGLECQEATPRYGYDIPKLIEEADLTEHFEACFDLSLRLHSFLVEAGYPHEAQYAVLTGHKVRFSMTQSADEALRMHSAFASDSHSATTQRLMQAMQDILAASHPLIGEATLSDAA